MDRLCHFHRHNQFPYLLALIRSFAYNLKGFLIFRIRYICVIFFNLSCYILISPQHLQKNLLIKMNRSSKKSTTKIYIEICIRFYSFLFNRISISSQHFLHLNYDITDIRTLQNLGNCK